VPDPKTDIKQSASLSSTAGFEQKGSHGNGPHQIMITSGVTSLGNEAHHPQFDANKVGSTKHSSHRVTRRSSQNRNLKTQAGSPRTPNGQLAQSNTQTHLNKVKKPSQIEQPG